MIVAGSWVEGLYIATHISQETFENKEMVKILLSQKEPLEKLVKLLDEVQGEPNVTGLRQALQPLYNIYSNVDASSISEEQMVAIRSESEVIRKALVEP